MKLTEDKLSYPTEEHALSNIFDQSYPSFESLKENSSGFEALIQWIKGFFHSSKVKNGWGGRIRTHGWRDQNPLPYRLATPQSQNGLSQYPNWELLKDTTKNKFLGLLILIFLFSSACQANADISEIDNTYHSEVLIRNNRGSSIDNLRKYKDSFLYTSQNELFYNLEKINLNTIDNEDFRINNLIVDDQDFYLLTSIGIFKNFKKIFSKEECFHLQKTKNKIWISCQSGIYSSSSKTNESDNFNWELDNKSPQAVIYFTLNQSQSKPNYAASSQFGFFKYEKAQWQKRNIGLRANPDGDYEFGRFIVHSEYGLETIYLPTNYGIAISNNQAKNFFLDSEGIEKENGLISAKEINFDQNKNLILISNTGAYRAALELIPKWSKIEFKDLRKSENNYTRFNAIDIQNKDIYLSTDQGEIVSLKEKSTKIADDLYGANYFNTQELIKKFLDLEPQIAAVHQKALEFAGIPTGANYQDYIKKAKLRNIAPSLESYLERDNQDLLSIQTTGQDDLDGGSFSTSFDRVDENRNNNSLNTGIRLSWDLSKLIYDEEIMDINNNARLTANIRENLLTEITQLYFQRKETIASAINWLHDSMNLKTSQEFLKQKLKLEESLAQLDARTGSWYSKALNKNLFSIDLKDPNTLKTMELYSNVKIN